MILSCLYSSLDIVNILTSKAHQVKLKKQTPLVNHEDHETFSSNQGFFFMLW